MLSRDSTIGELAQRWSDIAFRAVIIISGLALLYQSASLLIRDQLASDSSLSVNSFNERYVTYRRGAHFPGWSKLEYLFIGGDSYTATGFNPKGAQPSHENPIGNPDFPGDTLTNGPSWPGYLTATYNETFLRTINFASGGATVDETILHPDIPGLKGLAFEIEEQFLPIYASHSQTSPINWTANNSLFFVWIGINDIGNAQADDELNAAMDRYVGLVDKVYHAGIRNFMFLNVPPIHRSPHAVEEHDEAQWEIWIEAWNTNITKLATNLTEVYPEVTRFVFDTYTLINDVIEQPGHFPETASIKDTTTFCPMYAFGTDSWNTSNVDCEYPVDKYLWMNDFHPTTLIHDLIAHEVARALRTEWKFGRHFPHI